METRCAPTYANIFLTKLQEKYVVSFISKIFLSENWTKSENELGNFMKDLNTKHSITKFNFKYF